MQDLCVPSEIQVGPPLEAVWQGGWAGSIPEVPGRSWQKTQHSLCPVWRGFWNCQFSAFVPAPRMALEVNSSRAALHAKSHSQVSAATKYAPECATGLLPTPQSSLGGITSTGQDLPALLPKLSSAILSPLCTGAAWCCSGHSSSLGPAGRGGA